MLLGCIADDITGATDVALMLNEAGMRTVQVMGVPRSPAARAVFDDFDAVVVALKSRTIPADEAVAQSLEAARALQAAGARQLLFKYCSTFDSTPQGNIGPVAEALLEEVGGDLAIVCPAFPANARSIYMSNLFVGAQPLAESPMKDHPLTPMRDSNLVRVMQAQTRARVSAVTHAVVAQGVNQVREALAVARENGERFVVTDAISNDDLLVLGAAVNAMALVTGGSGIAMGLPANFERAGLLKRGAVAAKLAAIPGRGAILAGSCSAATRTQIEHAQKAGLPTQAVDAHAIAKGALTPAMVAAWAAEQAAAHPVLVYSSAGPDAIAEVQAELGREAAGALVETFFGDLAMALVDAGVTRLIVAGGETSGAVVHALGIEALDIGPAIDPGVPWTRAVAGGTPGLALACKSGNFGAADFFTKAWALLDEVQP
ncbi:MAG: 3-oxo-tetronate kinase [Pseudomonadota bacterium]